MSAVATPTRQNNAPAAPAEKVIAQRSAQARADCQRIFGEIAPEDVIAPIKMAYEALDWLRELLRTIALEPDVPPRLKSLADMGAYVAGDLSNTAQCCYEDMSKAIQAEREGQA